MKDFKKLTNEEIVSLLEELEPDKNILLEIQQRFSYYVTHGDVPQYDTAKETYL